MWHSDEVEFINISIRGKEYDPKVLGISMIRPPTVEGPYWEIDYKDGTTLITTDVITVRLKKRDIFQNEDKQSGEGNDSYRII